MSDWPIILPAQLVRGRLKLNRVRLTKLLASKRDCELAIVIEKKHATAASRSRPTTGRPSSAAFRTTPVGMSTTKLNKIQFGEYVEAIRQWSAETLDLNIPDPLPLEMVS